CAGPLVTVVVAAAGLAALAQLVLALLVAPNEVDRLLYHLLRAARRRTRRPPRATGEAARAGRQVRQEVWSGPKGLSMLLTRVSNALDTGSGLSCPDRLDGLVLLES